MLQHNNYLTLVEYSKINNNKRFLLTKLNGILSNNSLGIIYKTTQTLFMAAYRALVGRVVSGEVSALYWRVKAVQVTARVVAGMIYIQDPESRTDRVLSPGSLDEFDVAETAAGDRMGWATD